VSGGVTSGGAAPPRDPSADEATAERLVESLLAFIRVLRHLGLGVTPAETVDALTALTLVDLSDRGAVRAALHATLVKTEGQSALFDGAFEAFFAPPEVREARLASWRRARAAEAESLSEASGELKFQGEPLDLSPEQLRTYTRLSEEDQRRLREFLAESSAGFNVDRKFQPIIQSIVRGHLDRLRQAQAGPPAVPSPPPTGDEDLDAVLEVALEAASGVEGDPLLYLDMKDIAAADLPRATRLIRRLAQRLATRLARRYRRSHRRRRPDMRRTVRSNIRHGGVLFDLRFRDRRVLRPRLLVIADVSGSMARYTAFTLELIFGLASVVRGVEAFVFAEELERVTDRVTQALKAGAGGEPAAERVIRESRVWGRGTELGAALEQFFAGHAGLLTHDTVVVIVSDTKTLGAERAARLLEKMRARTRRVLWLNTLPREEWPQHRTATLFAGLVDMHECYTLAHLERVIRAGLGRPVRRR